MSILPAECGQGDRFLQSKSNKFSFIFINLAAICNNKLGDAYQPFDNSILSYDFYIAVFCGISVL